MFKVSTIDFWYEIIETIFNENPVENQIDMICDNRFRDTLFKIIFLIYDFDLFSTFYMFRNLNSELFYIFFYFKFNIIVTNMKHYVKFIR